MFRSIMVPFTDWHTDHATLGTAVQLAQRSGARLHLVHVQIGKRPRATKAEHAAIQQAAGWASEELNESVTFRMVVHSIDGVRPSGVAVALCKYARRNAIELIILTRKRSRLNRILLGSVGEGLVARFEGPILVLPAHQTLSRLRGCRILVPLDGTGAAEVILPHVLSLGQLTSGSITLLRVVPPSPRCTPGSRFAQTTPEEAIARETESQGYLDAVAQRIQAGQTHIETLTLLGDDVLPVVEQAAVATRTEIVALARRPHLDDIPFLTESITDRLLERLDTALLVCRQPWHTGQPGSSWEVIPPLETATAQPV